MTKEPTRIDLFKEADDYMRATGKQLAEDVPGLLGWLTSAVNASMAASADQASAPLDDGFDEWWASHRVKRVLSPAGVVRQVWKAAARHNRAARSVSST